MSHADLVDEASLGSMVCSDSPTWSGLHVGPPQSIRVAPPPPAPRPRTSAAAVARGAVCIAAGLWPIVHRRSFEQLTGRKVVVDRRVMAVGLVLVGLGVASWLLARGPRLT